MPNKSKGKKESLLQKAKKARTKVSYKSKSNPEMRELAVAWLKGEITTGQANFAIRGENKKNNTSVLFQLCTAIREAARDNEITINYKKLS